MSKPERKNSGDKLNEISGKFEELFKKDLESNILKGDFFNFLEVEGILNSPNSVKKDSYIGGTYLNETATDRYHHIYDLLNSIFPTTQKRAQYEPHEGVRYALRKKVWQQGVKGAPEAVAGALSGAVGGAMKLFGKKEEEVVYAEPEAATGINRFFLDVFFTDGTNESPLEALWKSTPKDVKIDLAEEGAARRKFVKDLRAATLKFICDRFNCRPEDVVGAGNQLGYKITPEIVAQCNEKSGNCLAENFNKPLDKSEWKQFFSKVQEDADNGPEAEYDPSKSCKDLLLQFFSEDFKSTVNDDEEVSQYQVSALGYFSEKFNCSAEDIKNLFKITIKDLGSESKEAEVVFHAVEKPANVENVENKVSKENSLIANIQEKVDDEWTSFLLMTRDARLSYNKLQNPNFLSSGWFPTKPIINLLNEDFFEKKSSLQIFADADKSSEERKNIVNKLRVEIVKSLCNKFSCTASDLKNICTTIEDDVIDQVDGGDKQVLSSLVPKVFNPLGGKKDKGRDSQ